MKKFLYATFLFALLFLVYKFIDTYGLLESRGEGIVDTPIGKWEIAINDIDITQTRRISLTDFVIDDNPNLEPGFFAPGSKATYDIIIDPRNTDVSIRYDIIVDAKSIADFPQISFLVEGDVVMTEENGMLVASGIIPLSDIQAGIKKNIKTSLIWESKEEYSELDNSISKILISFAIRFTQYAGEDL